VRPSFCLSTVLFLYLFVLLPFCFTTFLFLTTRGRCYICFVCACVPFRVYII
jgi:hypothetical protein